MTSAAILSTPNLSIPLTQNTAPVLEFRCLYTHDIRKKAKKWQDGFLRFHTFNRRVMVYDGPRNFIGDVHWRQSQQVEDGDELQLDKGILVQVQENIGRTEQDVTEVIAKRRNVDEPSASTTQVPPASIRARNAASSQLRPKSLNSLLGIIKAPMGRANIPARSPFEVRQQENRIEAERGGPEPPPKRRRISNDEYQSRTIESPPRRQEDGSRQSKVMPRGRGEASQPARLKKPKESEVVDISDDDHPPINARTVPPSKSTFKIPKSVDDSPRSAASNPKDTAKSTKQSVRRPREPSPEEVPIPKPKKSKQSRSKARPTEDEDEDDGTAGTPVRTKKAGMSRNLPLDDSPAHRRRNVESQRDDERPSAARKRKETQKKTLVTKQKEAESALHAQQERVAERLKQAQRRKDQEREEAQRKREAERRRSPSPPLPTNVLRFAPSKPVRKIMYRDLLAKPKLTPPDPGGTQKAIETMQRQTREGQARIRERLERRRLSDTSHVDPEEAPIDEVDEDPCNDSDDVPDLDGLGGHEERGTLHNSHGEAPSPGHARSQTSLPQQRGTQQTLAQQGLEPNFLKSPRLSPRQQVHRPSSLQESPQLPVDLPSTPDPGPEGRTAAPPLPNSIPPNNDLPSPQQQLPEAKRTPPPLNSSPCTPAASPLVRNSPIFPTPTQNTLTMLDQQLLLHSRPATSNDLSHPGSPIRTKPLFVISRSPPPRKPPSPLKRSISACDIRYTEIITITSNSPQLQQPLPDTQTRQPPPPPLKSTTTRQIGLPPPRPIAKPPRTLHPNARPPPQPQIQPRRLPPPTRTVIMRRTNSTTSNDSVNSNDSRASEKSPSWAGMKPWSAEAWDVLGWWPPEYDKIR